MFNKIIKRSWRKAVKSDERRRSCHAPHGAAPPNIPQRRKTSAAVAPQRPSLDAIEILPMFRDVITTEHQNLFLMKVKICCVRFDFSDALNMAKEKRIQRHTLIELADFVGSSSGKITEANQEEMVKMISRNIFRCLPPSGCEVTKPGAEDPFLDPEWLQLQPVYELLSRYVVASDTKVAKRYIDPSFILKLLDLFDSKNPIEREYLKTILHRIYGKFVLHRAFIRKTVSNIFFGFMYETGRHNGIAELLEVIGSIINGLVWPMKEEHKLFLARALIPLHKSKGLTRYQSQLSYCITQFVEKDCRLADSVVTGLLKYWPVTNSEKEVLFFGELEEVLEGTDIAEFQRCLVPLFRRIARSINSTQFKVAERALSLLNNEHIVDLIAHNRNAILPIIFEALEKNLQSHWNQSVQSSTLHVRRTFMEMDPELFEYCQSLHEERQASSREAEEQRELIWRRLAAAAAEGG